MTEENLPTPEEKLPKNENIPDAGKKAAPEPNKDPSVQTEKPNSALQGQAFQDQTSSKKTKRKIPVLKLLILGIIIILIIASLAGAYFLGRNQSTPQYTENEIANPTPTPDPTAGWKTYENTKYNYSLKYPTSFYLVKGPAENLPDAEFQTSDTIGFSQVQSEENPNYGAELTIYVNPKDKNGNTIKCFYKEECIESFKNETLNSIPNNTETITKQIDNQTFSGFKYRSPNTSLYTQDGTYIGLYKNGYFYLISYTLNNETNGSLQSGIDQILSTFKFTDTSEASNSSAWKTYSGNGFSVSYDPRWTVNSENDGELISFYDMNTWKETTGNGGSKVGAPTMYFTVQVNKSTQTVKEYVDQALKGSEYNGVNPERSDTALRNYTGEIYKASGEGSHGYYLVLSNGKKIVSINIPFSDLMQDKTIWNMLATFQFTN